MGIRGPNTKIDLEEARSLRQEGKSLREIGNIFGVTGEAVRLVLKAKTDDSSKQVKVRRKGGGRDFPTFEELEMVLGERREAIDKMIRTIARAKQADLYKEEVEKYKRGYHNLMEAVEAEKKAEKKKTQQKLAYDLAVQKGELPKLDM